MYYSTGTIKNTFSVLGTLHDCMLYFLKKVLKIGIHTEGLPLRFPSRIFGRHSNRTEDKNLFRFAQTEDQDYGSLYQKPKNIFSFRIHYSLRVTCLSESCTHDPLTFVFFHSDENKHKRCDTSPQPSRFSHSSLSCTLRFLGFCSSTSKRLTTSSEESMYRNLTSSMYDDQPSV